MSKQMVTRCYCNYHLWYGKDCAWVNTGNWDEWNKNWSELILHRNGMQCDEVEWLECEVKWCTGGSKVACEIEMTNQPLTNN